MPPPPRKIRRFSREQLVEVLVARNVFTVDVVDVMSEFFLIFDLFGEVSSAIFQRFLILRVSVNKRHTFWAP